MLSPNANGEPYAFHALPARSLKCSKNMQFGNDARFNVLVVKTSQVSSSIARLDQVLKVFALQRTSTGASVTHHRSPHHQPLSDRSRDF
jgi:hypothetical protein